LGFQPGLAIVQVGNREDSNIYIKNKIKSAFDVIIETKHYKFSSNITQAEILNEINKLNTSSLVHGIIVQLPFDSSNFS
jgi:methylenetetrahydrofolate dehydrogenase (NADP+)/methenyltetrahydrofolate cyclohydrolase/formyltetrahydrofolate synthetase